MEERNKRQLAKKKKKKSVMRETKSWVEKKKRMFKQ
jgi:hypothetical protein